MSKYIQKLPNGEIKVEVGYLTQLHRAKISGVEYIVGCLTGITNPNLTTSPYTEEEPSTEFLKRIIKSISFFRIVDDSNRFPGWAILEVETSIRKLRKFCRILREEAQEQDRQLAKENR